MATGNKYLDPISKYIKKLLTPLSSFRVRVYAKVANDITSNKSKLAAIALTKYSVFISLAHP